MTTKTKQKYSEEEKKKFLAENTRVLFWCNKEVMQLFDAYCESKGVRRSEGLNKILEKFVEKAKHKIPKE